MKSTEWGIYTKLHRSTIKSSSSFLLTKDLKMSHLLIAINSPQEQHTRIASLLVKPNAKEQTIDQTAMSLSSLLDGYWQQLRI
mmetsp:Transcript_26793/g.39639  ORF Transcript_26793/g.39639 Transcript_26793/m.39639 type:complete len:83 (-) Transcript_26793:1305-1553(-)